MFIYVLHSHRFVQKVCNAHLNEYVNWIAMFEQIEFFHLDTNIPGYAGLLKAGWYKHSVHYTTGSDLFVPLTVHKEILYKCVRTTYNIFGNSLDVMVR